ncbi:MAG: HEAT repeat domain-containing protein [Caulobacteraceae bacterium]
MSSLPARPDLERRRREARALQRADGGALNAAQLALARGYGFPSWPALKAEVEARRAAPPKSDADLDAEALALQWFSLSEADDLRPLGRAMKVSKRRTEAARASMRTDRARYQAFQDALVRGLSSPRERVRAECAHALAAFGDFAARARLAEAMDDPVPRVRRSAMYAISARAGSDAATRRLAPEISGRILAAALGDPSARVRFHAAVALGMARETGARAALEAMLARETDEKIRRGLVWALSQLDRPAKAAPAGL